MFVEKRFSFFLEKSVNCKSSVETYTLTKRTVDIAYRCSVICQMRLLMDGVCFFSTQVAYVCA